MQYGGITANTKQCQFNVTSGEIKAYKFDVSCPTFAFIDHMALKNRCFSFRINASEVYMASLIEEPLSCSKRHEFL